MVYSLRIIHLNFLMQSYLIDIHKWCLSRQVKWRSPCSAAELWRIWFSLLKAENKQIIFCHLSSVERYGRPKEKFRIWDPNSSILFFSHGLCFSFFEVKTSLGTLTTFGMGKILWTSGTITLTRFLLSLSTIQRNYCQGNGLGKISGERDRF